MTDRFVAGVDGGGTTTRVLVADESGEVHGYAEAGGSNPAHNRREAAKQNVRDGIERAVSAADTDVGSVAALTAGMAGLDGVEDESWARSFLAVPGLACEPTVVNDAVVAHAGALESQSGIVAICGTGSVVVGITEDGRTVRNYDFAHYARAAARHIGSRAVVELIGRGNPESAFARQLFDHWDLDSMVDLRERLLDDEYFTTDESGNAFDSVAPLVTDGASAGSPLACDVCDDALDEVVDAVRAVGSYFENGPVPVAPMGAVLRSEYMSRELGDRVAESTRFRFVEPTLSPVAGAVYMSLDRIGSTDGVIDTLRDHPASEP